jgi:hypothetical protein
MARSPVFICGFPRSGTTLFRALLGQHSQMHFVNEPELIYAMRRAGMSARTKVPRQNRSELLERLREVSLARAHLDRLPKEAIQNLLIAPDPLCFRDLYEILLPRPNGSITWGEKSLNNLFFTNDILTIYPRALIIHLVRDPRACILSHARKHGAANEIGYFKLQAETWRRWMEVAQSIDGLLEIRFEDLIVDPERLLLDVCGRIGVQFEPTMLEAANRADDPVLDTKSAESHANITREIDPERAISYAKLPTPLLHTVEKEAKAMMNVYGYEAVSPEPSKLERWRMIVAEACTYYRRKRKLRRHFNRRLIAS